MDFKINCIPDFFDSMISTDVKIENNLLVLLKAGK